jgi:hypothetical protein
MQGQDELKNLKLYREIISVKKKNKKQIIITKEKVKIKL